jgi:hypothetical protein
MNEYMIVIRFSASYDEKFLALIPLQRVQVNYLMEKRIITSYSLSADRETLWVTMLATSREGAEKTLRMMPLYNYMQYEIVELMFHNSPIHESIHLSLN